MKKILMIAVLTMLSISIFSQGKKFVFKVVSIVSKESFYLNSGGRAAIGGKSRNYIMITLPPNTVEWYYAITTTPNENQQANIGLAGQLLKFLNPGIGIASTAITSILTPKGSGVIDAYLITNTADLNNFINKKTFSHIITGSRENFREGIVQIRDAVTGIYYLSLRNTSAFTATNVTLEVAAIVKENAD